METQHPRPSLLPRPDWRRTAAIFICVAVAFTGLTYLVAYGVTGGNSRSAPPGRQPSAENLPPLDNEIEHLPERRPSTTEKVDALDCDGYVAGIVPSTPGRDWKTAPLAGGFQLEHPPEWEVEATPGGVMLTSPAFPEIDVIAVVETDFPDRSDDLLEVIGETLALFDPDVELISAGADTLAERDACRGTAHAPNLDTNFEFWISASGDDVILVLIAIPDGAERFALFDARGVAASLTQGTTA